MSILNFQNVALSLGGNTLFEDATFNVESHNKIALIGKNGSGKTSLIKMIIGEYQPDTGKIFAPASLKIGYMEQYSCTENNTVYDELLSVFSDLISMEEEINSLTEKMAHDTNSDLIARYDELSYKFNRDGGLTYKSRTRSALIGLGFSESEFSRDTGSLSGGEKSRLVLAKLLLSGADLLLLDEPTNHLDITALEWLEKFLHDYSGALIVVSHDRYFLDKVVSRTIEITNKKLYVFKGNYSEFMAKKENQQKSIEQKYKNDLKEVARLEKIIERERQWNREKSIKTAESKEKVKARLEQQMVIPDSKEDKVRFDFKIKQESGDDVLTVKNLNMQFGDKQIISDVSFDIKKGQRVFLIGANGAGKTTVLKLITKEYIPQSGSISIGTNVNIGYFDQTQENLCLNKTIYEEIRDAFSTFTETKIRTALAAFLFKGDEVYKQIAACSGGEKARVALLELMLGGYNFLLLDEPTNHVDATTRDELEKMLLLYGGTMLIVSHDRYFINRIATNLMALKDGKLQEFDGNYDDYTNSIGSESDILQHTDKKKNGHKVNEYTLKKERSSKINALRGKISKLEKSIDIVESEISTIRSNLEQESSYEILANLSTDLDEKLRECDDLYEQWGNLNDELTLLNK